MDYEQDNAAEWDLSPTHARAASSETREDPKSHSNITRETKNAQRVSRPSSPDLESHPLHQSRNSQPSRSYGTQTLHQESYSAKFKGEKSSTPYKRVPSRQLHANYSNPTRSKDRTGLWPKIRPQNGYTEREDERERKGQKRQLGQVRRAGLEKSSWGHVGIYVLSPDDLDSTELQHTADSISSLCQCAVTYDAEAHVLRVTAQQNEAVQSSLSLIRAKLQNTTHHGDAQLFLLVDPSETVRLEDIDVFLVDANSKLATPKAVGLSFGASPGIINERLPLISFRSSSFEPANATRLEFPNLVTLRARLLRTVERLARRQASMQMRLTFGALVFHKYQWPAHSEKQPIENFLRSLHLPGTTASIYMLHTHALLYERVARASKFLAPWSTNVADLGQTTPFLVGKFMWYDDEQKAPHVFEVVTDLLPLDGLTIPSVKTRGWVSPSEIGSTQEMDAFLTHMNGGVSCALQVTSSPASNGDLRPTEPLTAQQTRMLAVPNFAQVAKTGRMIFDPRPSRCRRYRQRAVWRFRLKMDQRYIFDLVRHDGYSDHTEASDLKRDPIETRWTATVQCDDWDTMFVGNQVDTAGSIGLNPSLDTFFPPLQLTPSTDGFQSFFRWMTEFLNCLNREERTA